MRLEVVVNKWLFMWHLLYGPSISTDLNSIKQDIYKNYPNEYKRVHKDKISILSEGNDFIPDDDLVYNILEENPLYKKLKQDTNRYRLSVMEMWDKERKKYIKEMNSILKFEIEKPYKICVIHPSLDFIETDMDDRIITMGKRILPNDSGNFLTYLMYKIIKNEISKENFDDSDIVDAILELSIVNELGTRIANESRYRIGKKDIREIKEKIYPYFLMYLGVSFDSFDSYMVRDNIFFDKNSYPYEKILIKLDLYGFIKFVIKNKRVILRKKLVPVENIEVL